MLFKFKDLVARQHPTIVNTDLDTAINQSLQRLCVTSWLAVSSKTAAGMVGHMFPQVRAISDHTLMIKAYHF